MIGIGSKVEHIYSHRVGEVECLIDCRESAIVKSTVTHRGQPVNLCIEYPLRSLREIEVENVQVEV